MRASLMAKSWQQVGSAVANRGLVSVMNDTKWRELQQAVRSELPFTPPYQLKVVLKDVPDVEQFDKDVDYLGDWANECLCPFFEIEWIRVRPRYLHRRGRLLAPEVRSVEAQFLAILHRYHIPHRRNGDSIWIYGYTTQTIDLTCGD
jgi:hypothetical protein